MANKKDNPTIGHVICPFNGESSPVRRGRGSKLYYYNKGIGIINPQGIAFQEWIKKNATFDPPAVELPIEKGEAEEVAEVIQQVSESHIIAGVAVHSGDDVALLTPKKKGLIESIFGEW